MPVIEYLSETHILIFLVQIFLLLSLAKAFGSFFQQRGYPALAGEILTGILLGPTIFGRLLPELWQSVFPPEQVQYNMLETVSWFGVLFLLLVTGFEVRLSSVWKQGRNSLIVGAVGVIIPMIIGVAVFWWLPSGCWGDGANRLTFSLFMAAAASISAISVIARVLHDLDILKSDFGLHILSSFVVNDIMGWLIFTLVLGMVAGISHGQHDILRVIFEILTFGALCLTVGSRVLGFITRKLLSFNLPQTATALTLVTCLGIMCGIITQWIGIHAILGFFLAGIMAGNTPEISEHTREIISQMVHAVFVPLFFATIGIKVDFINNFDPLVTIIFLAVAMLGKLFGAWAGARMVRLPRPESFSVGIAFIPGGAMEIILGMLALEMQIIPEKVFVAVVFTALASSVAVGPLLAWSLNRRKRKGSSSFLRQERIIMDLEGDTRESIISELCMAACAEKLPVDCTELSKIVMEREDLMGTALENGIAIPHGRIKGLKEPRIYFGLSVEGVDWDARDGLPVNFIFLVLTPLEDQEAQVMIVSALARMMMQKGMRHDIFACQDRESLYCLFQTGLAAAKSAVE